MSTRTYGEVNRELGFSEEFAAQIAVTLGVPRLGACDLVREDDIAF
jgi:hypothetical protein